ncbi:MAG: RimK family protein [Chromatiales bacterium]|nr:RimK family protein [Chromatiales bacterium]
MSDHVLLVEDKRHWKDHFPTIPVVSARDYLSDADWQGRKGLRVVNLCSTRRHLGIGYYSSLLAEARGHKVIPSVRTIQDLSRRSLYSLEIEDLDKRVQKVLGRRRAGLEVTSWNLWVLFGECAPKEMQALARGLFELFRAPILRVELRLQGGNWRVAAIKSVSLPELPEAEEERFLAAMEGYLSRRWRSPRARRGPRYDLAILHDPDDPLPPSNPKAIKAFVRAAQSLGINAELITRKDFGRLAEYDALFIRETTAVDHHTYRFARKAASESMVVIDDPDSILRCTNKIYLAELLAAHRVGTPRTVIVRPDNLETVEAEIPYPVVIKIPDGSFSRGVVKVENRAELERTAARLFKESDLLLAQEYLYTDFDWRVGIINREVLYVCRYYMAGGHWQILDHSSNTQGDADTLAPEQWPAEVVRTALKAANLIGDGLYGVDLKDSDRGVLVIEVNDNPSIDQGVEDEVAGDELYRRIMAEFLRRLESKRSGG